MDDLVLLVVTPADEEVLGLDVAVDEVVPVHHFYSIDLPEPKCHQHPFGPNDSATKRESATKWRLG